MRHNVFCALLLAFTACLAQQSSAIAAAQLLKNIPYGEHRDQTLDVYLPEKPEKAPVIFMVHGGAWRIGDKSSRAVVENKVRRWVPKGFVFISINNRLLPDATPVEQASDVAQALVKAQAKVESLGADPHRFILMGHSAGAHLVSLVNAKPARAIELGAKPWLGVVLLDSAALDLVTLMQAPHPRLYDKAFGKSPHAWRNASPYHVLTASAFPVLAVCSSLRSDACPQAHQFVKKALSLGVSAQVLEQSKSHGDINRDLGADLVYTEAVEGWMKALNPTLGF